MKAPDWVLAVLLVGLTLSCLAQEPSVPEQESVTTLRASTHLVVLDIVVPTERQYWTADLTPEGQQFH